MALPEADIKILWGRAAGHCSNPGCRRELTQLLPSGRWIHVGEHAHIIARSPKGPRGVDGISTAETETYENYILLCPNCHTLVDKSPDSYPPELLRAWKSAHEAWAQDRIREALVGITFSELEVICESISNASPNGSTTEFILTPPAEKMRKNGLSPRLYTMISMGLSQARTVRDFLAKYEEIDPQFNQRLIAGFRAAYEEARLQGLSGDKLFHHLATPRGSDLPHLAARLALVCYLFHACDIFEP